METQLTIWDYLNITHEKRKPSWKEQMLAFLEYRDKLEEHLNCMCERCINHEVCMGTGCAPRNDLHKFLMEVRLTKGREE